MFKRDEFEIANGPLFVIPIHHASLVMEWNGEVIYCDPVGGAERYRSLARPTIIVLTHHHGDHMDFETLDPLVGEDTVLVAPRIVYDQMPADMAAKTRLMANGDQTEVNGIGLSAVPMYNTSPTASNTMRKASAMVMSSISQARGSISPPTPSPPPKWTVSARSTSPSFP